MAAAWLVECGHDAVHASDVGVDRTTDTAIIVRGRTEDRIIITADLDHPRLMALTLAARRSHPAARSGLFSAAAVRELFASALTSRLMALAFKALRGLRPDYPLWRDFPYEYLEDRLAIDALNGGPLLREWVDDPAATIADLEALLAADETAWRAERAEALLYWSAPQS